MLVTARAVTIGGRAYGAGEGVDASLLPPGKADQLVARRILKDLSAEASARQLIVLRDVTIKGRLLKKGTRVNAAKLDPAKVAQMLDHRILGPAPPA